MTLTYDDEHLPTEVLDTKAEKKPVQLFLKRLRAALPQKIRYFLCCEYGDRGNRLHYHAIIFNASVFDAEAIDTAWGNGFTQVGECNEATIKYVTKYVTKGDSRAKEKEHRPTWAIMSRRPGIGKSFIQSAGRRALTLFERSNEGGLPEVQGFVRWGARSRPIGRFLTGELRTSAGYDSGCQTERERETRIHLERAKVIQRGGPAAHRVADVAERNQENLNALAKINLQKSKGKL